MIKISIIVPVYNTEKYLDKCLNSIINQNFKELEIIIVNDCSIDNSLKIIKKYMKIDERIILINKEKNEGLSAARNSGIEIAKGKYLLHIDSDDWIEQNYFKDMYEYAIANDADIVISDYYKNYNNKSSVYIKGQKETNDIRIEKIKVIENIFLFKGSTSVWNKLIKIELYKKNKIKHPKGISLGEDLAVIPKLMYYSKKIVILNKAYYHYIQNPLSITKKYDKNKIYEIYKVLKINEEFFYKENIRLPISELKINHLSGWVFQIKYDFNDEKYIKVLNEYLKLLKEIKIKNLRNIKLKVIAGIFKIFRNKYIFILIWNINSLKNRGIKLRKNK